MKTFLSSLLFVSLFGRSAAGAHSLVTTEKIDDFRKVINNNITPIEAAPNCGFETRTATIEQDVKLTTGSACPVADSACALSFKNGLIAYRSRQSANNLLIFQL